MPSMLRSYKVEMRPNNKQRTLLLKNAGAARWAYNWGLTQKKLAMELKQKIPSAIDLHVRLNRLKKTELAWMYECSKCAPQEALRNLDRAFDRFWKARKAGKKAGFPKYKSKKNGIGGFRLTGRIVVSADRIRLPRLGVIRLKESDYIPTEARVISTTVTERSGKWFVSVQVELERPECNAIKDERSVVGIDLGIKTLATVSDGTVYENTKPLKASLKKLRRLQRAVARKVKGSSNRRKAVGRVARLHLKVSNIRRDTLHKMTTRLTKTKSVVGIEDLNVLGMMRNRSLARSIADLGLGEWRRQMTYKGDWYGCKIVVADRFFPSSKTCHACGEINEALTLDVRQWTCSCGAQHDRDMNAAYNLEYVATSSLET